MTGSQAPVALTGATGFVGRALEGLRLIIEGA